MSEQQLREFGEAWSEDPNDVEKLGDLLREGIPYLLRTFTEVEQNEEKDTLAIWPYESNVGWRAEWSNGMEIEITVRVNKQADEPWKCGKCGVETFPIDVPTSAEEFTEDMIECELCPDCYVAEMEEAENAHA